MTAIKLAWLELRRFRGPLRQVVPVVLILVPLLYGATYLWANWDPYGKIDRVPVAVVDQDQLAHTSQGQRVDAGGQIVQQLKASKTFDWNVTDAADARDGLAHGRYFFTVTIPPEFSAKLATAANPDPQHAGIMIGLNDANNYLAGIMTEVVQTKLQDQVNAAAHAAYVRSIYGELSGIRDKLTTASDGAHRLVGATQVAEEGSASLTSGTAALHTGAGQITEGTGQIAEAAGRLDTMAGKLTGTAAKALPAVTGGLVDTARLASQGLDTVHAGTAGVKQQTGRGVADLNGLANAHPELRGDPLYARTIEHAKQLDAGAGRVDAQSGSAAGQAHEALQQARDIQSRTGSLQRQVLDLQTPVHLVDTGSHTVTAGAGTLTRGLDVLHQGSGTLHTAADQARDAATDLAGTVDDSRKRIPPTDPDQVARSAEVLSSPVHIERSNLHPAGVYGRGLAPFFFGIALWVFGLFAYLLLRPVNLRALAARVRASTLALAGWLPAAALGIAGALVLYTVVDLGLGLDPVHAWLTVLLLAVGAASFVAVDHFLRTALGVPGDVLSLVLLILQLTSSGGLYPMPTAPGFFQALNPVLPMTYLIDGLRITISGGLTSHLIRDFGVLAGFGVLFLSLTALAIRRQRIWTVSRLHPDVEL
ncbi:YhgE/Pip domain-containing protein [Sciscionella marina]|uniref:YhgE/Pip domain-containing protein n=1 Tax=Sciscionella marina TaxID=508770 RepID=UPI0003697147|nr:YhgE/Pip domain-containing protein [Sciscionella marina]